MPRSTLLAIPIIGSGHLFPKRLEFFLLGPRTSDPNFTEIWTVSLSLTTSGAKRLPYIPRTHSDGKRSSWVAAEGKTVHNRHGPTQTLTHTTLKTWRFFDLRQSKGGWKGNVEQSVYILKCLETCEYLCSEHRALGHTVERNNSWSNKLHTFLSNIDMTWTHKRCSCLLFCVHFPWWFPVDTRFHCFHVSIQIERVKVGHPCREGSAGWGDL